jgi:HEAT repeat protein
MVAVVLACLLTLQDDAGARVDQLLKDLSDKNPRKRDAATQELTKNAVAWRKILQAKAPELKDEKQRKMVVDLAESARLRDPEEMKPMAEDFMQSDAVSQALRTGCVFEDRLRYHLKTNGFDPDDAAILALLLHLAPKLTRENARASVAHSLAVLAGSGGAAAVVTIILDWTKDEHAIVRAACVDALADLRASQTAPRVLELIHDPSPIVRFRALRAMGLLGGKEHLPALEKLLHDSDPRVREGALDDVFAIDSEAARPHSRAALADDDPRVRHLALKQAMRLRDREAHARVAKLFQDPEPTIRADAVRFMTRMRVTDHMDELCKLSKDADETVQIRVAQSLRLLNQKDRLQVLSELLKDRAADVRLEAVKTLGVFEAKEFSKDIAKLIGDGVVRYAAVMALARMKAADQVDAILKVAKDRDQDQAAKGIDALVEMGAPEAIPVMQENLKADRGRAMISSVIGLGRMGDTSSLDKIMELPQNRPEILSIVAVYFMAVGMKDKREVIEKALKDQNPIFAKRMTAMASLLRDRSRWTKIMRAEFDPDAETVGELIEELTRQTGLKVTIDGSRDVLSNPNPIRYPISVYELTQYIVNNTPFTVVVEDGGIRLLPPPAAKTYIQDWLKDWK